MNRRRLLALARRQQRLLGQSQDLRERFARDAAAWRPPLALADRAVRAWRWLRVHPEVPLAAAAVLVVLRPQRAWRWGWRLWAGWRAFRQLQQRALGLF